MITETIEHAEDLMDALAPRDSRWHNRRSDWVFRGQADSAWDLVPTAFRENNSFQYSPDEPFRKRSTHFEQIAQEADALRFFLMGVDRQGLALPNHAGFAWIDPISMVNDIAALVERDLWPPRELEPLLALAQHHGVPTRLLDWTERPLIAAYFAALGAVKQSEGSSIDSLAVWTLDIMHARLWLQGAENPQLKLIRAPRGSNPNLRAQEGVFTVLVDSTRKSDDFPDFPALNQFLAERFESSRGMLYYDLPILRKLELPITQAGLLLRLLAEEGISATHLYPGFDGVVAGMRERGYWNRV